MFRQCAWCRLILGEIEPLHDLTITHTCNACKAAHIFGYLYLEGEKPCTNSPSSSGASSSGS